MPTLYLDADGFFATCEESADERLHGRPVAVATMDPAARAACVIAVNLEAKRHGVGKGENARDAKKAVRELRIRPQRPELYVGSHHAIAGPIITVSCGIGPYAFLAKTAAEANKPGAAVVWRTANIPGVYEGLEISDLPGLEPATGARLRRRAIDTVRELYDAERTQGRERTQPKLGENSRARRWRAASTGNAGYPAALHLRVARSDEDVRSKRRRKAAWMRKPNRPTRTPSTAPATRWSGTTSASPRRCSAGRTDGRDSWE